MLELAWRSQGEDRESVVRFEIVPREQGVLLVLEHRDFEPAGAPGYGAGWHPHLKALARTLPGGRPALIERYHELLPEYERRAAALP